MKNIRGTAKTKDWPISKISEFYDWKCKHKIKKMKNQFLKLRFQNQVSIGIPNTKATILIWAPSVKFPTSYEKNDEKKEN